MKNIATFLDLYQLTMLQSYWREGMDKEAVFSLFIRRLKNRDYLVACGVDGVLDQLENFSFTSEELEFLDSLDQFNDDFVEHLEDFEFTGDVYGVDEGTVVYPSEPILEVVGPIGEAQIVETFLLNQVGFQTNIASKAAHVVDSTEGQTVADFGMRRAQGFDAAMKGSRSMYIGGVDASSNVAAGREYGIPITGTMAHSYVESHDSEVDAFLEFTKTYPNTVLLVDTYDTMTGVMKSVYLMEETGNEISGIRLDSGDLVQLSKDAREYLDQNGYPDVKIFASDGLDEDEIERLLSEGAKIDGFGVGSKMATAADQAYADAVYKLCQYDGEPRMKLSSGKSNLAGRKQVHRFEEKDIITVFGENIPGGETLLSKRMENGDKVSSPSTLDEARSRTERGKGKREVVVSEKLESKTDLTAEKLSSEW